MTYKKVTIILRYNLKYLFVNRAPGYNSNLRLGKKLKGEQYLQGEQMNFKCDTKCVFEAGRRSSFFFYVDKGDELLCLLLSFLCSST